MIWIVSLPARSLLIAAAALLAAITPLAAGAADPAIATALVA